MTLGWILAAYSVPSWCWVGTVLVLLHLSKRGIGAIPVALAWSNGILWISAYSYANPSSFEWRNAKQWALSIIAIWLGTTFLAFLMAQIPTLWRVNRPKRLKPWLATISVIASSLGLGTFLYHLGQGPSPQ